MGETDNTSNVDRSNNKQIIANADKSVPKFVSTINFKQTRQGGVVMTLLGDSPAENDRIVVETIYLEKEHAAEVAEILKKVVETKNHE